MANRIVEYPVPLMLKKILKEKIHGELRVRNESFEKRLFFIQGDLIFARTNVIQERLGEILFKIGKINPAQFWNINKLLEGKDGKVGKILVEEKIVTQRDLFLALLYQVKAIATSTFTMDSGEWEFNTQMPQVPADSNFKVEMPEVMVEGTKKMRNMAYFRNRFYYQTPKLGPLSEPVKRALPKEILHFYQLLSNFNNKPNEKIIAELKMDEDVYWKNVVLLFLLSAAEFVDVKVDEDLNKNIEEMMRLYEKVRSGSYDYYELFGLKSNTPIEEIKEAYFRFAKKYHPDRVSQAPDPDIKEKSNYVFSEINKAYEILSDDNKRREYDLKGPEAGGGDESIKEKMIEKARMLYRKAKTLYAQKKFWEAQALLEQAVRLGDEKASYYLLLGLCQINLPAMRRMAEKNLQKAIELEHWNAEAYAALGLLFYSEQHLKRAEGFFRKALSINPDHDLSRKKLLEITGKDEGKKRFSFFGKKK